MTPLTFTAVAVGMVLSAAAGYQLAPRDAHESVNVNVREGPPATSDTVDAVVHVRADLIEEAVREALSGSDLPFEIDRVEVTAVREGYHVEARLGAERLGVRVRGTLTTDVHPMPNDEGTVSVELSSTKLVGARLPGAVEDTLRSVVSREVSDATRLEGYRVVDVETSEHELIVYLALTHPLEDVFDQ